MFVGRIPETDSLVSGLQQAEADNPTHYLITGERGIGKTSLLTYLRYVAEGHIPNDDDGYHSFLVIDITVDQIVAKRLY